MKSFLLVFLVCLFSVFSCSKKGGTVTPAETAVTLSVDDVTLFEGNTSTTNFEFSLTLDKPSPEVVSVVIATANGSAKSEEDFTGIVNQTISFQPNETVKKVTVLVQGDTKKEEDETFMVTLSGVVNATVQKPTGTATIRNDDAVSNFTQLVWSDEFSGTALNGAAWSYELGDGCQKNLCGWGNNELQAYTNRPENLYFQDGNMIIESRKEPWEGRQYTSARIITQGKKAFKFGKIEMRAKLPKGKGIWPAFWLLPQNNVYGGWPRSGEIDIMEYLGHETTKVYGTVHYGPGPSSIQISKNYTLPNSNFHDDFHVFSIEWDLNEIRWYMDGVLYSTVNKINFGSVTYPFNEDFFIIINLAVGGNWPGNPDATTTFPQQLVIDYVRVYQ